MSSTIDKFFNTDFEENLKLFSIGYSLIIIAMLVSYGIYAWYQTTSAVLFLALLLFMLLVYGLELSAPKKRKFLGAFFLGKLPNFLIAIALGATIGWILGISPFAFVATPTSLSSLSTPESVPLSIVPSLNFVYIVFLAPIVEATFFRGWLFPQLTVIFRQFLPYPQFIALTAVSLAFATFHVFVYNGEISLLIGAFTFSVIAGLASVLLKSLGFELAAHFVINFLTGAY